MAIVDFEKHDPTWFFDLRSSLQAYVHARSERAFVAGEAARDAIRDRAGLEQRQRHIRERFLAGIGGLPAMDTPLAAKVTGETRCDGFRIENVVFESRPGHHVTGNLYLPDGLSGRSAAVMFVCGHHDDARMSDQYQNVCQHLVRAGLVVWAQDPIGQGERWSYWDPALGRTTVNQNVPEHDHVGWQCLPTGESLGRWFLHDIMRGMDFMRTRAEIDPARIGITGNSGGGTQASMAMLADPRFAAAAPATFIMDRRGYQRSGGGQDAEQIWPGFTAAGLDHEDILLAMAPKPVRVLAVTWDFFPIDATRRTVARSQRVWEVCGAAGGLDLVEDRSVHNYTPALARAAAAFFSRHLLGREVQVVSATVATLPVAKLRVTPSGQVRGTYPQTRMVHEDLVDRLPQLAKARAGKRAEALTWLRQRALAYRVACDPVLRVYGSSAQEELTVETGLWWSQPGLINHGILFRATARGDARLPVTIALWDGGTKRLAPHLAWLRATCAAGRAVLVLNASGLGLCAPYGPEGQFGRLHSLTTDLMFLGDDLCALRTHDCVRTLAALDEWPGVDLADVRGYADGRDGVPLRLAALIEPRIRGVEVAGGPADFADWVRARHYDWTGILGATLIGALAHFDLPEVEAAPASAGKA